MQNVGVKAKFTVRQPEDSPMSVAEEIREWVQTIFATLDADDRDTEITITIGLEDI